MLDNRIYTFINLCETMNYRKTAENLSMTQPAVTQHIQFLEQEYGCKLFNYDKRKLSRTQDAEKLLSCARSALYNEINLRNLLKRDKPITMRIGATKTIGNYEIAQKISHLLADNNILLSVIIDNTENLLRMIDNGELDFALVEGYFDRSKYDCTLMKKVDFVGICKKSHAFAGKMVSPSELYGQKILIREKGSGTRAIFERFLLNRNYSINQFENVSEISSFELLKSCLRQTDAITFAYKTVATSDSELTTFYLDEKIYGEFNYVYLRNTSAKAFVDKFKNI
ncbi:MAG: LysR family transcriptional regulator [Clostridia bacterium]|nr:LysR family transcriptional regulator [Clostridia bacterium]